MGLIKITADMTDAERTAVLNTNLQYLQLSNRLRKYPIGMIVAFDTDIDPNELFGGTWERIKGRFIYGIDDGETAGTTGGEKAHTLTVSEIPAHAHTEHGAVMVWNTTVGNVGADPARKEMASAAKVSPALNTGSTGGGQPHNNMPPYYGAYIWRKTAHGIGEDPTLTEYEAMMKQMNDALSQTKTLCNLLFSNALRGSASGEAVRLTDVSPLEHTLTVKLKSKNLLPFPYFHSSMTNQVGIAYTVNSDGTITANGTATGRSEFVLSANKSDWASGNYVLSGCPSGGSADTYFLQTINGFSDTGSGLQKNDTAEFARISIIIKKGTTVSNLVFKPQLELGTTPTAYTPYISDLTSVNVTRYGKNLTTPQQVYKGATAYSEEIFENKNCVRFSSGVTIKNSPIAFKPNTQYTVSFDVKTVLRSGQTTSGTDAVFCFFYDDDTLSTIYNTYTQPDWEHKVFTSTVDKTVVAVGLTSREYRSYSYVDIDSFQLEESSTVTLCEPYQAQKYIPSADGTVSGAKSLYPITTLMTDTAGVIIEAEYNRDINKAFAELQQAILSTGGNV